MLRRDVLFATWVGLYGGCGLEHGPGPQGTPPPVANAPVEPGEAPPPGDSGPGTAIEPEAAAVRPTDADPVVKAKANEVEGIFDIDRIPGGKRFQGSWLEPAHGERLVLSYRPMPEYFAYVEKRVVVTGERYTPQGQAISSAHFRVTSMRLAEGETARPDIPSALPVPPRCEDATALLGRLGRWVQVWGTLVDARPAEVGGNWQDVILRLDDGTELRVREAERIVDQEYRPRFGTRVTMTGKAMRDDDGSWRLGSAAALCEGEVDGCGMTVESVR